MSVQGPGNHQCCSPNISSSPPHPDSCGIALPISVQGNVGESHLYSFVSQCKIYYSPFSCLEMHGNRIHGTSVSWAPE